MKKIFAFFMFIICAPILCLGRDDYFIDRCVPEHANEFTTDKRCYVVNVSSSFKKPYSAVVALVDEDDYNYCTGTIVKFGKSFYVVTAKHCTYNNSQYIPDDKLIAVTYDQDTKLYLDKAMTGVYDNYKDMYAGGDWAVYRIRNSEDVGDRYVGISDIVPNTYKIYDARAVGYGALKVMSDKEIDDFKQKYIHYLKTYEGYSYYFPGVDEEEGGIWTHNDEVQKFINDFLVEENIGYYIDVFSVDIFLLKVSYCNYSGSGKYLGCQTWGGNSGGPIFDKDGNLMAIHTRGRTVIGGKYHAAAGDSINLLGLKEFLGMLERVNIW